MKVFWVNNDIKIIKNKKDLRLNSNYLITKFQLRAACLKLIDFFATQNV